ncbi:MAG: FtsH protease activity modulator HflK [Eubacteriales bacterium]|nr:FtsH protease activity modulator HflK [Eubacteriales bacterium]
MMNGNDGFNRNNPFGSFSGRGKNSGTETYDANGRRICRSFPFKKLIPVLVIVLALFVGANCYYVLDEENYAVVTTLGNPVAESQAGLHFKIPFIQKVQKVSKVIMGMPIGYDPDTGESIDEESVMITKDFNFVNTDFYLSYMVSDPVKYLYASENPEATLKMLAQSYIRDTVGIYNVDDVITTGKSEIQSEIQEKLTQRMIEEDIGLAVVSITIQDAFPPTTEVLNAFKNVENAKQGKETAINNANKERNEQIPAAEAECDQIIKDAEAEKEARINEAEGQVSRFEQMYAEYMKYPLITKQRMFYETMEEVLPSLRVYIVDESGTQKLLPLDTFTSRSGSDSVRNESAAQQTQNGAEENAQEDGE